MTNEEAVETLKQLILQGTDERLKKDYEALDIAIKALETGEVYMTGEDYNLYMEGYKAGKRDFEPKQGEWIDVNGDGSLWKCNNCGEKSCCKGNYCPDCGANMQKGGADNENS